MVTLEDVIKLDNGKQITITGNEFNKVTFKNTLSESIVENN